MNEKNKVFDFDNKTKEILNARLVMALFKGLYNKKRITKKEYDLLVSNVCRTFNLNEKIS